MGNHPDGISALSILMLQYLTVAPLLVIFPLSSSKGLALDLMGELAIPWHWE